MVEASVEGSVRTRRVSASTTPVPMEAAAAVAARNRAVRAASSIVLLRNFLIRVTSSSLLYRL